MAHIVTTEPSTPQLQQLDTLLQAAEANPDPTARAQTRQIVQTLMDFHGAAIGRICWYLAEAGDEGQAMLQALGNDELIASVLLLYGLHPDSLQSRVNGALEKVQPSVRATGGNLKLVAIVDDGTVRSSVRSRRRFMPPRRTCPRLRSRRTQNLGHSFQ